MIEKDKHPMPKEIEDKEQFQSFIETAREHECNESEEAFLGKLKKLAGHKPQPEMEEKGVKD